jgi:cyclophilin family peptidyl-prolyl cis-trans isomerase
MKNSTALLLLALLFLSASCANREPVVTITTEFGEIVIILYDQTPEHKKNFVELARGGFYDSTTFHRIIDNFMIQGGDPNSKDDNPTNDGRGSPGYTIAAEFVEDLTHIQGAVAAARQPDQVNPEKKSNGSQFYIVEPELGTHFLDGEYTVFGKVIQGLEVVEEIAIQPKNIRSNRPLTDIKMTMKVKTMPKRRITKLYGYEFPTEE